MKSETGITNIDAVILCGGLGTRLRSVVDGRPKVLAEVGGKPFLDRLIEYLFSNRISRIVLSIGYLKDHIKARYASYDLKFAEEERPLGTGGGLKNAESFLTAERVLVMNGDSWLSNVIDLAELMQFHVRKNALITMVLARPRAEKDYGAVFIDTDSKITLFNEKQNLEGEHFMNAGIYVMNRNVFDRMPQGVFSLENDFFPKLVGDAFYGFPIDAELIDIGTPERFEAAQRVFYS